MLAVLGLRTGIQAALATILRTHMSGCVYPVALTCIISTDSSQSFDPNPTWSSTYASSAEIYNYFKKFQARFNLGDKTKVGHQVVHAQWVGETGKWFVDIENLKSGDVSRDSCDILINAGGILNAWRWPLIPGLKDFRGQLVHSAAWDESIDIGGKHVGLIGNG